MRTFIPAVHGSYEDYDALSLTSEDESILDQLNEWYVNSEAQIAIRAILNGRKLLIEMADAKTNELVRIRSAMEDFMVAAMEELADMRHVAITSMDEGHFDAERIGVTSVEDAIKLSDPQQMKPRTSVVVETIN